MFRTILWDNDGVLVDTEGLFFEATRRVLSGRGVKVTLDLFRDYSLREGRSLFELAETQGLGPQDIESLRAERNRLYAALLATQVKVMDGVRETLEALHGRYRMGIVTSSRRDHFETMHQHTGLLRYFEFAVTLEDTSRTKPHPDAYWAALERLKLRPENGVAVEDSPRGLTAARAAGLRCLMVPHHLTRDQRFEGAEKILASVRQIPAELARMAAQESGSTG